MGRFVAGVNVAQGLGVAVTSFLNSIKACEESSFLGDVDVTLSVDGHVGHQT